MHLGQGSLCRCAGTVGWRSAPRTSDPATPVSLTKQAASPGAALKHAERNVPFPPGSQGTDVYLTAPGGSSAILEADLAVCGGRAVIHIINGALGVLWCTTAGRAVVA